MAPGTLKRNPQADVILIILDFIPQNVTTMADLRETIRNMHITLPPKFLARNPRRGIPCSICINLAFHRLEGNIGLHQT